MFRRDERKERGISVSLGVETGRAEKSRGRQRKPPERLLPSQPEGCRWPPVYYRFRSADMDPRQDDARPDLNK